MLTRIDGITADIDLVQAHIDGQIAPFAKAVARLDEIPDIGVTSARAIIAEIGLDMTRFAPGVSESADRNKGNSSTGHGNRYLARAPGEGDHRRQQNRHFPG
jgi:transposase